MDLNKEWVRMRLPKRPVNANKGTFGKVLAVAGSENYPGAAYLSCAACYRVGVGLVSLVANTTVKTIVSKQLPEVTFLSESEVCHKLDKYNSIIIGPGLGEAATTYQLVEELLKQQLPKAVIDGDGLNILAKIGDWRGRIMQAVLTPHPGEMSRLTGLSVEEIQADRINVVQHFANKWKKVVVLKGANTLVASPAGEVLVSPFANPILATAGTGDILAGIIAGLQAQGLNLLDASGVGVYIHGLAGEKLEEKIGNAGGLASDILPLLPQVIKELS